MNDKCILFFVKCPIEGQVKTRLSPDFGTAETLSLYKCFILDLLKTLEGLGINIQICYYPPIAGGKVAEWLGDKYSYLAQDGDSLGHRMKNAFEQAFQSGFKKVVLIGSDSPDLPFWFLQEAFFALEQNDAVLGPCEDGGYYLIGFSHKSFLADSFESIRWSSYNVFEATLNRLREYHRSVHVLPAWYDVDTFEDLKKLVDRNREDKTGAEKTMTFLWQFGELLKDER